MKHKKLTLRGIFVSPWKVLRIQFLVKKHVIKSEKL